MKIFKILLVGFVASVLSSRVYANTTKINLDVERYQLKNGLTVLLHKDDSAPIVSIHQWYRVGSRHEKVGRTGLAHFFEHLMFKGTPLVSGKELEQVIQKNGGVNNAFTSRDYTGYYANMPSDKLEVILKIESDRMRNLLFKQKEITSEREVVKEERRYRVENSVTGSLYEAMFKTVFKVSPYRWPVIGYMKDLNAASINDLKDFYQSYYAPNNSVLVVAGSFNKSKVKKLINKYYQGIPVSKIRPEVDVPEPKQSAFRKTILKKDVQAATVAVAYKTVPAGHKDVYALDLMGMILGSGSSSRLYKDIVYKKQVASSTFAGGYNLGKEGLFIVYGSLKTGKSSKVVESSIFRESKKLQKVLVSLKELEKVKNITLKNYVDSLKSVSGKAQSLALNEILFGDYSEMFKDMDNYLKVTPEDVMRVARKYLNKSNASMVKILPKKGAK